MKAPSSGWLGAWRRWMRPQPAAPCACKHPSFVHDLTMLWGGIGACSLCDCKTYEPEQTPAGAK